MVRPFFFAVPALLLALLSFIVGDAVRPQPKTILYKDHSQPNQRVYIKDAMSAWSGTLGVRWQKAPSPDEADVVFKSVPSKRLDAVCRSEGLENSCVGWSSTIGNAAGPTRILFSYHLSMDNFRALAIHELGHFFGLHHQEECSIMTDKNVLSPLCPNNRERAFRCSLTDDHRRQLQRLYSLSDLPKKRMPCLSREQMKERIEFYE